MSMWTSVTITFPRGEEVAALESMVALWNASVDGEHGLQIGETVRDASVYVGGRALGFDSDFGLDDRGAHLAYHDKYETEGLGTFGEAFTLGRIEVGEDFFEHFTRREAEALATVYDTADMAEIAGEIRRKCAEADPEAWAEEVDAVTS